jgi:hypothetical protein
VHKVLEINKPYSENEQFNVCHCTVQHKVSFHFISNLHAKIQECRVIEREGGENPSKRISIHCFNCFISIKREGSENPSKRISIHCFNHRLISSINSFRGCPENFQWSINADSVSERGAANNKVLSLSKQVRNHKQLLTLMEEAQLHVPQDSTPPNNRNMEIPKVVPRFL